MGEALQIGRYVLYDEIASGGMAKVHLGRLSGAVGFSKTVAIKRIHPHLLGEQDFFEMFVDETRLAARIQHPNVVTTLDAVVSDHEVFLVMELVLGEAFGRLLREGRKRRELVPVPIAIAIACGMLRGLQAAHETKSDLGIPLGVVHRDVSPQNVMVGVDGAARILDFGVAKAAGRLQSTRQGQIKGKVSYMSPEQLQGREPDQRTDLYATAVVLWEALAGRRLFHGDNDAIVYSKVLNGLVEPLSATRGDVPQAVDVVVMRALSRDPAARWATAQEMVLALEAAVNPASPTAVGEWVKRLAGDAIEARSVRIAQIERGEYVAAPSSQRLLPPGSAPSVPSFSSQPSQPSQSSQPSRSGPNMGEHSETSANAYGASIRTNAPQKRSWILPAILGIAGVLALTGIALIVVARKASLHASAQPAQTSAEVASSSPSAPPLAATIEQAAPPSTASDPPQPQRSDRDAAGVGPDAGPIAARPARGPAPQAPVVRAAKPTCDPPWVLDAKGIKRFKPECL